MRMASGTAPGGDAGHSATSLRLFAALWPGDQTRDALAALQRGSSWPAQARVVMAPDLHLTLAFIGAVTVDVLATMHAAAAVRGAALALSLDQVEVWKGGTVVLRPSRLPQSLIALHGRLTASLCAAGIAFDDSRPFAPHVTLARKAPGARVALPGCGVPWHSAGHVLAASCRGRYRVVARFG